MGKKICLCCANYLPNLGGIERYVNNLAKRLTAAGHSVTVLTSNVFRLPEHEFADGVEIFRMPCFNVMKGRYPVPKRGRAFRKLKKELEGRQFDLTVINARFYLHSVFCAKLAKKQGSPCFTIDHGSAHMTVGNRFLDALGAKWEHHLTRKLRKYCEHYYGVSQAACDWLAHFGIKAEGALYNAVDPDELISAAENPVCDYRSDLGIPENAVVFAYAGRLVEEKGAAQLAQAFRKADVPRSFLLYAGDGQLMPALEKEADSDGRIKILGKLDFPHVAALLKAADVFCLPTVYPEGLPTSLLEAAAVKDFIISTTCGGGRELVPDGTYGILLDGNDPDELAEAMKTAAGDPEYRRSAAEKCFRLLCERFTWERTAEKIAALAEKGGCE